MARSDADGLAEISRKLIRHRIALGVPTAVELVLETVLDPSSNGNGAGVGFRPVRLPVPIVRGWIVAYVLVQTRARRLTWIDGLRGCSCGRGNAIGGASRQRQHDVSLRNTWRRDARTNDDGGHCNRPYSSSHELTPFLLLVWTVGDHKTVCCVHSVSVNLAGSTSAAIRNDARPFDFGNAPRSSDRDHHISRHTYLRLERQVLSKGSGSSRGQLGSLSQGRRLNHCAGLDRTGFHIRLLSSARLLTRRGATAPWTGQRPAFAEAIAPGNDTVSRRAKWACRSRQSQSRQMPHTAARHSSVSHGDCTAIVPMWLAGQSWDTAFGANLRHTAAARLGP